jgi:hypothetical protein
MPSSKSSNSGSEPQQNRMAITIDPKFADRLMAVLERIGAAYVPDGSDGKPDPTRERTARDYDVLRGLLGRTDAPQPLRMNRVPSPCGGGEPEAKARQGQTGGDNALMVLDVIPPTAECAIVESPVQGSDPLREEVEIPDLLTPPVCLELETITKDKPISRVEIFDDKSRLVAFGPSAGPIL